MKIRGFRDTIKWYDKNAAKYAESTLATASLDQINEFLELIPKGGKVLDAGCGVGRDTNIFADKGYEAVGVDLSTGLLKEAKKRYHKVKFIKGNLLNLPFPENYFEGVWAHASLLHLETVEDVKRAITEFKRVLKEKGTLHILVKAQTGVQKTAVVSDSISKHDRFFQYFTKDEMNNLLIKGGFGVVKLEQYRESERNPKGRPEVEWILGLAKK